MVLISRTNVLAWCLHGHRVQNFILKKLQLTKIFLVLFFWRNEFYICTLSMTYLPHKKWKIRTIMTFLIVISWTIFHISILNCISSHTTIKLKAKRRFNTVSILMFYNLTEQTMHTCCQHPTGLCTLPDIITTCRKLKYISDEWPLLV